MKSINVYLSFDGKAEEAFGFYRSVFGGEISAINRFKEMPGSEKLTEEDRQKVMHISLPLNESFTLMGSDMIQSLGRKMEVGNHVTLSLSPKTEQDAKRIFERLSRDGEVTMPIQKTFWNALYGMVTDKYGVPWMINYEY